MDHLLGLFGGGEPPEKDEGSGNPPQKQDGVWEFEMPAGGMPPPQGPQGFSIPGGVPPETVDLQESTIEGYFTTLGWPFERVDQGLWIIKYKGGAKDYDIFVELTPRLLVLVAALVDRVRDGCREKLWHHILRLNYQTNQLRFGLNKRDELLVTLEIPLGTISFEEFKNSSNHLCTVVDDAYPEILFLSQRLEALSSFKKEPGSPAREDMPLQG